MGQSTSSAPIVLNREDIQFRENIEKNNDFKRTGDFGGLHNLENQPKIDHPPAQDNVTSEKMQVKAIK